MNIFPLNIKNLNYMSKDKKILKDIKPKQFKFKGEKSGKIHFGFLAQDLEKKFPQMVSTVNNIKRVNYIEMIPLLVLKYRQLENKLRQLEENQEK